jgi:hypothetical protein
VLASLFAASGARAQSPAPASPTTPAAKPIAAPIPVTTLPAVAPQGSTSTAPTRDWPRLVTPEKAKDAAAAEAAETNKAGAAKPLVWSAAEIASAQARCVEVLRGLDVVAVGAAPIRDGHECGAAAPVELVSVGKNPQVTFSPTVTVTCEMAAALHTWVVRDLQPLAKRHLGAPLIRIDTMSSYSCRNAYNRVRTKLSEHGRANAVDIRAFTTAKAETTDLLANWGPTQREIQAQIAAAKAAAQKAAAEKALAANKAVPAVPGPAVAAPSAVANNGNTATTAPGAGAPAAALTSESPPALLPGLPGLTIGSGRFGPPSRLGGPKPSDSVVRLRPGTSMSAPEIPVPPSPALRGANQDFVGRTQFLRQAHVTACKVFGTVLGPEANNAHKNHFHVDLAERRASAFCE